MKFLIFSDVHFHPHGGNRERLDDTIKVLDWVVETYKKEKCDCLLFLGDWSHIPLHTHNLVIDYTIEFIKKLEKENIAMYALVGNHDAPNKNNPYQGLPYFNISKLITVVYDPIVMNLDDTNIHMISWYDTQTLIEKIKNIKIDKNKKNILLLHADIKGGLINVNFESEEGVEPDLLDKFDNVFLGHYHVHQIIKNKIVYVGSLTTTRHNEEGTHGIIIYDTKNGWKFVENSVSPQHIKLTSDKIDKSLCKNNYIKLYIKNDEDANSLMEKAYNMGAKGVTICLDRNQKIKNYDYNMENVESLNPITIFRKYVETAEIPSNIKKELLLEMGEKIIMECDND